MKKKIIISCVMGFYLMCLMACTQKSEIYFEEYGKEAEVTKEIEDLIEATKETEDLQGQEVLHAVLQILNHCNLIQDLSVM